MAISKQAVPQIGLGKFGQRKSMALKPRRQRWVLLSDSELTNRRDQLVQFLETAWGQIGWDLRRARKPQDVQKAIALTGFETTGCRDLLMPFVRASDAKSDSAKMRALRRKIGQLNEKCYAASQARQPAVEAMQNAQMALNNCSKANLKIVKRECKRRERQAKRANERYAVLDQGRNQLTAELQNTEAAFAQAEVLKLVKSKRYSYTPLHLANGMAGLPYMGWRQSALRCSRHPCQFANGLWYSTFTIIRRVIEKLPDKSASRIDSRLRKAIANIRGRDQLYIQKHLAENWFFLKRAIQNVCETHPHPKALPFRVTADFLKQRQSQRAEDRVLAEMGKLDFSRP